ncbi:MAG: hypothetical protein ACXAC5_10320 [Promethearchaeota archaeon]|jgi:hypothetical protein
MLVLKHVEYEISDNTQLQTLTDHLNKTTDQIDGIKLIDIYFPKNKKEFVLFLECEEEAVYHDWRKICPPPDGANDWFEIFLTKEENF